MKMLLSIIMLLVISCRDSTLPAYEDTLVMDKLTGSYIRLNDVEFFSNTNKVGDSILYVGKIHACKFTKDGIFICDQELQKDSFFVELNRKPYFVTLGMTCIRFICLNYYDMNPCYKYLNGYMCN